MRKLSSVSLCLLGVLGCGDDGGSGGGGGQGATSTSSSGQTSSGQTTSSSTTTTTTGVGGGGTGGGGGGGGLVGGEIIWQRPTNVTSLIGTDEAGNLYAGGPGVDGDFGPQPATIPVDGAFYTLAKIDPTGQTVIWRKTYAATVSAMSVGRDGAVVLGHLTGLIKLDPDGNEIWTIPTPLGGGPFVLSTDGRVWGQRSVVDGAGAVTSWRAPGGFITLAEWDAGEHVVGVKRDSQNAVYLVDATNLDGSPAWSKSVPKPTCTSCAVRLTLHASVGGRTFIRQDFPSDPGVTFDIRS